MNDNPDGTSNSEYKWENKTVLIAEDVNTNFVFIKRVLQNTKINIIYANNGKVAVELFQKNPSIDLILMDIEMPDTNGYEATEIIRKQNTTIPIIAQTAYSFEEEKIKYAESGFTDCLIKPISRNSLLEIMSKYL